MAGSASKAGSVRVSGSGGMFGPGGVFGPGHTWAQLHAPRFWWTVGWLMVAFVLYATLSPEQDVPDLGMLNDKIEHGLAFFGMTGWFGGLMSRRRYWQLGVAMSLFGAAIEVAQGTMGLGRDMDYRDWVADSIGVVIALGLLYAVVGLSGGTWMRLVERAVEQLLGRGPQTPGSSGTPE